MNTMKTPFHKPKVLVVDDDELSLEMLENTLFQGGYDVTVAHNGCEAMEYVRTGQFHLVVSDWEMPEMSGLDLCRSIRERGRSRYIYVILLTSRAGTNNVVEGLSAGADEFLTKPFDPQELFVRLRVGERILSLESRDITIFTLAKLAESRDLETGTHLERMREYCRILSEQLALNAKFKHVIDGEFIDLIYLTSPLHDIGKVGVPDRVLLKPGRLDDEEMAIIRQHAAIGGRTLDAAAMVHPEADYLQMARDIAWFHHERFDGKGYPQGLSGENIPLTARIVALADVYDALTTQRVYKPAFSHEASREIIIEERGTHFDPDIVDAFLECEDRFVEVRQRLDSDESATTFLAMCEQPVGAT